MKKDIFRQHRHLVAIPALAISLLFWLAILPGVTSNTSGTEATSVEPLGHAAPSARLTPSRSSALVNRASIAPVASVSATKSDSLFADSNGDGNADPGDTIEYSVTITNSGTMDATGLFFSDTIDANTTLVPGSLIITPVAVNDIYQTIGNVNISVSAAEGLLFNDFDPDSGTVMIDSVNTAGAQGTVNVNIGDGSFTFNPNAGFQGTTSFSYTIKDGDNNTATATVTINVNGMIWFVDAAASGGGDGRLTSPFNCIGSGGCFDPVTDAQDNDNIFVYSGTYASGLALRSGQKLIGQGANQSILALTGLPAPSGADLLPGTGATKPVIQNATADAIFLNGVSNVLITGMEIFNPGDHGINSVSSSNVSITYSKITDNANNTALSDDDQHSINFSNLSGTNTIDNVVFDGINEDGISLINSAGTLSGLTISNCTFSNHQAAVGEHGIDIRASSSANVTVTVDTCTFDINSEGSLGVTATTTNTASGAINVTVQNSTFNAADAFGPGTISLINDGTSAATFKAIDNQINQANANGIFIRANGNSTLSAVVTGNVMTALAGNIGIAISVQGDANVAADAPMVNASIQNNTVGAGFLQGILTDMRDSGNAATRFDATVNNNTVGQPTGAITPGIRIRARQTGTTCARVAGNISAGNSAAGILLQQSNASILNIEQGSASLADAPATVLTTNNPGSTGAASGTVTVVANGTCGVAPMSIDPVFETQSAVRRRKDNIERLARHTLGAASGESPFEYAGATLTQYELQPILRAAIARYAAKGLPADQVAWLESISIEIADLPDGDLASATAKLIQIDATAAGYGWFIDLTPDDNSEFEKVAKYNEYKAKRAGMAEGQIDLLTVVMREIAFVLREGEIGYSVRLRRLSLDMLPMSTRRLPQGNVIRIMPADPVIEPEPGLPKDGVRTISTTSATKPSTIVEPAQAEPYMADAIYHQSLGPAYSRIVNVGLNPVRGSFAANGRFAALTRPLSSGAFSPVSGETVDASIPTLPAGASVTIKFKVTINDPLPEGVCEVSNQGTVTGDGGINVLTDDPDTGEAGDATKTPILAPPTITTAPADGSTTNLNTSGECLVSFEFTATATGCPAPTVTCKIGNDVITSPHNFPVGTSIVTCTASTGQGSDATSSFTVIVTDNEPPVLSPCPDNISVLENPQGSNQAVVTYTTPTAADNCGANVVCDPASGSSFPVGTTTVTCTATDPSDNTDTCSFMVTVSPACVINSVTITAPPSGALYQVGQPVTFSGNFTGSPGTHTATWTFASNLPPIQQQGNVNEATGEVSLTYAFTQAGVYLVSLTVTDVCGATGTADTVSPDGLTAMVVIYDPNGGFVTGGGWINSPIGAYVADPALTGKASFGFVSKYQNGASVPTGNTEFQFRIANFNFKSTLYEWLVVAGARAQFKGSGTVNGSGNYGFLLTAIDGQRPGGGGADKFRIKIWDKNNNDLVVYDNQIGAGDNDNPATVIGGGSIVIHN